MKLVHAKYWMERSHNYVMLSEVKNINSCCILAVVIEVVDSLTLSSTELSLY